MAFKKEIADYYNTDLDSRGKDCKCYGLKAFRTYLVDIKGIGKTGKRTSQYDPPCRLKKLNSMLTGKVVYNKNNTRREIECYDGRISLFAVVDYFMSKEQYNNTIAFLEELYVKLSSVDRNKSFPSEWQNECKSFKSFDSIRSSLRRYIEFIKSLKKDDIIEEGPIGIEQVKFLWDWNKIVKVLRYDKNAINHIWDLRFNTQDRINRGRDLYFTTRAYNQFFAVAQYDSSIGNNFRGYTPAEWYNKWRNTLKNMTYILVGEPDNYTAHYLREIKEISIDRSIKNGCNVIVTLDNDTTGMMITPYCVKNGGEVGTICKEMTVTEMREIQLGHIIAINDVLKNNQNNLPCHQIIKKEIQKIVKDKFGDEWPDSDKLTPHIVNFLSSKNESAFVHELLEEIIDIIGKGIKGFVLQHGSENSKGQEDPLTLKEFEVVGINYRVGV